MKEPSTKVREVRRERDGKKLASEVK